MSGAISVGEKSARQRAARLRKYGQHLGGAAPATLTAVRAAAEQMGEIFTLILAGQDSREVLDTLRSPDLTAVAPVPVEATAEALTAGEHSFLVQHSGLAEETLSEAGHNRAQEAYAEGRTQAAAELAATSLTTKQVAALLGRAESNVRRSRLAGHLYSPGAGNGQSLLFPRWQFTNDGQVVPGLKDVLAALPDYLHPLSVDRFMTEPHDGLGGQSPVQWLTTGGPVEPVAALADELGYS